jgi:predicted permease
MIGDAEPDRHRILTTPWARTQARRVTGEAGLSDLRLAVRTLSKRPGLVVLAIGSLALGIAINVTVFTVLNAILLRSPAVPDPGSLILVGQPTFTYAQQQSLREAMASDGELLAFRSDGAVPLEGETPEVPVETVTDNYFASLDLRPAMGTLFAPGAAAVAAVEPDVVVSHHLWTTRLASDPRVVGRPIRLGRMHGRILGVAPPGFRGLMGPMAGDVWLTASRAELAMAKPPAYWNALLRTRPGTSVDHARGSLSAAIAHLPGLDPALQRDVRVISLVEMGRLILMLVTVFMAVPGLVLLVACANVSGLLAARAEERKVEMAVRLAIGGNRRRLVRQLLAEGIVLAAGAAASGLLLARWMVDALAPWLLPTLANYAMHPELRLDLRAAGVAGGLAVVAALGASLLPALAATRPDLSPLLKGGSGSPGKRRIPYRDGLVVAQLAVTFAFVVTAVLCNRTLAGRLDAALGFDAERVLSVGVYRASAAGTHASAAYQDLLDRVRAIPAVREATLSSTPPAWPAAPAPIRTLETPDEVVAAARNAVGAEYLAVSGARVLRGRFFDEADVRLERPVAVVSLALARRLWPEADPIGRSILIGDSGRPLEVVGIVPDPVEVARVEHSPGKAGAPTAYVPLGPVTLDAASGVALVVEARAGNAALLGPEIARLLHEHPALAMGPAQTLAQLNRIGLVQVEITSVVYTSLGALCVLLGTVGLFGTIARTVARRTSEIGVRMALGASRPEVMRLVLRRGLGLAAAGVALGVPAAFAAVRVFGSAVPDMPALDAATLAAGALLVTAAALGATWLPARRAALVDPLIALRHE